MTVLKLFEDTYQNQLIQSMNRGLESFFMNRDLKKLRLAALAMSNRYRQKIEVNQASFNMQLSCYEEYLAYLATRLPATFSVLERVFELTPLKNLGIESVLDIGSGPGTALWALGLNHPLKKILSFELDPQWINIAKKLWSFHPQAERLIAQWQQGDITNISVPSSDLIIASYSLSELSDEKRVEVLNKLLASTKKVLIWIEPGTPRCFKQIAQFREKVRHDPDISFLGPCPSYQLSGLQNPSSSLNQRYAPCPLYKPTDIKSSFEEPWCHFSVKLSRSKMHQEIKQTKENFEEEKFCYLAITKNKIPSSSDDRLLAEPKLRPGHVRLKVCTGHKVDEVVVARSSPSYKAMKKAYWGDLIPRIIK
jgi:ribosomal protein RSM22 (predicted rRNA methylase)